MMPQSEMKTWAVT